MRSWIGGLLLLLTLLVGVSAFGQRVLTQADSKDGVYLVFDRGDGASSYYRLTGDFQVFTDASTTATKFVTESALQFSGFGRTVGLTGDIFELIPHPPAPSPGGGEGGQIASVDWLKGQYKALYGSNYVRERDELGGGEASFVFHGQQGVVYPAYGTEKPSTDQLVIVALPTHSIVNYAGVDFVSAIQMRLSDDAGNVVWELTDTKGGFHPALRVSSRGNNHPDDANRWVKYGRYKLWVKNLSSDARAVQRIDFGTTKGTQILSSNVWPGREETFDLNIWQLVDGFDMYKINCNVWTSPAGK
jgi:hypothetical protein